MKSFNMKLDEDLYERIRKVAFDKKRSMAQIIRETIVRWLKIQGCE